MKTVDFSETIAASNLKVGRYRQLIVLMKICEYSRSWSFFGLGNDKGSFVATTHLVQAPS